MSYAKSLLIWMVITGSVLPLMAQQPTKPWSVLNDKKRSVILDTDIGNDIDDVLALDMLMKYIDDGKVDLLGVMNNKNSEYATRFLDLLLTWYGHSDIPIGKITDGPLLEGYGDYAKSIVEMNDSSGVIYPYSVTQHDTLMESHKLYRKLLATQPDQSVMVISIGFSTNLQRLLQSGPDEYSDLNGKELVAKKVYGLSLMGGS